MTMLEHQQCPVERRTLELQKTREAEKAGAAAERAHQRRQLAVIDQRVADHFGPLKEAIFEVMTELVDPLRDESAALKRQVADLQGRLDAKDEEVALRDRVAGLELSKAVDPLREAVAALRERVAAINVSAEIEPRVVDLQKRLDAKDEAIALRDRVAELHLSKAVDPLREAVAALRERVAAINVVAEIEPLAAENAALKRQVADLQGRLDAKDEAIALRDRVAGLELSKAVDPLREAVATLRSNVAAINRVRIEPLAAENQALSARCAALEKDLAGFSARLAKTLVASAYLADARAFVPGAVHYTGDIVVCNGSTHLAVRDTAAVPGQSDDWRCLARRGRDGRDAVSPTVRGAYDSAASYRASDIVVFGGSAWLARRDIRPGTLPFNGGGWCQIAAHGERGVQGERGPRGSRGAKGEKGENAAVQWHVDPRSYRAYPIKEDGTFAVEAMLNLRPMFEQFWADVNDGG